MKPASHTGERLKHVEAALKSYHEASLGCGRWVLRFEHLEHIDDDLSWGGLQSAAQAAVRPLRWAIRQQLCSKGGPGSPAALLCSACMLCRLLKTMVILSPFAAPLPKTPQIS